MALKIRALQKIFGSTGGAGEFGKIGSKAAGLPVTTKNLETIQELSQYDQGLNAIVSDQGTSVLPYLEDINSLFFLTTSQLAYLMQSGVPEWDDETEYYLGISFVIRGGILWKDVFGTGGTPNLNFDPLTNLDKWKPVTIDASLVDSGAADAYVLTSLSGTVAPQYLDGMKVTFKASATNTGASTVNVDTIGVKSITLPDGTALRAGEITINEFVDLIYDLGNDRFEIHQRMHGLIQSQENLTNAVGSSSATVPFDTSIPQHGEGLNYINLGFTPKYADSRVVVEVIMQCGLSVANTITCHCNSEGAGNSFMACAVRNDAASHIDSISMKEDIASWGTTLKTFSVWIGGASGIIKVNATSAGNMLGGILVSGIKISEYRN